MLDIRSIRATLPDGFDGEAACDQEPADHRRTKIAKFQGDRNAPEVRGLHGFVSNVEREQNETAGL